MSVAIGFQMICFGRIGLRALVSRNCAGVYVATNSREPRMTQSIVRCPFQKLDSGDKERI